MRFRSLLRPRRGLAWHCSTARIGPLPHWTPRDHHQHSLPHSTPQLASTSHRASSLLQTAPLAPHSWIFQADCQAATKKNADTGSARAIDVLYLLEENKFCIPNQSISQPAVHISDKTVAEAYTLFKFWVGVQKTWWEFTFDWSSSPFRSSFRDFKERALPWNTQV